MTASNPICMGCFLHNPLPPNPLPPPPYSQHFNFDKPVNHGLTENELEVLRLLGEAWNTFVALDRKHPDDNDEFRHAIHAAQQMVALRVARRVNPGVWFQPEK